MKELNGFARVELEPGEKKTVKIEIPINSLTIVKRNLEEIVEAGEFELFVGSSSRDEDLLKTTFKVIE
ncbi:MAG: fibronectin type III-like domain-contianing protein [bacterium]